MDIGLLTIPGCPHAGAAHRLFSRALALEGHDPESLVVREITTDAEALASGFGGSPTFSMGGADLFPSAAEPAMACRVYPTEGELAGLPTLESLRQAIRTRHA